MLGLFEGHGIAPPSDPARARAAIAAAQRVRTRCFLLFQVPGGGTGTETTTCSPRNASFGPDDAAAILDALDEPRRNPGRDFDTDTFSDLLRALAATGRKDVVPVIITALERMEAHSRLLDPRVSHTVGFELFAARDALTTLTYLEPYEQSWSAAVSNNERPPMIAGWRAWWDQNKNKTRATWQAESIERARRKLAGAKGEDAIDVAIALAMYKDTEREGVDALKRIVRSAACAESCWDARRVLNQIEPRGHWLPKQ